MADRGDAEDAENTAAHRLAAVGANTRFQVGNPGRPKGSRNKLGEAFIAALHDDFVEHGVQVIETVRLCKPDQYLKVVASILPKELNIKSDAFDGISDEQLAAIVAAATSALGIAGDCEGDARAATH